jgi:hypothetical protein
MELGITEAVRRLGSASQMASPIESIFRSGPTITIALLALVAVAISAEPVPSAQLVPPVPAVGPLFTFGPKVPPDRFCNLD